MCRQRFQPCAHTHLDRVVEQREQVGNEARVVGAAVGEAEQPGLQHLKQPKADRCLGIADQLLCDVCFDWFTWSGIPSQPLHAPQTKPDLGQVVQVDLRPVERRDGEHVVGAEAHQLLHHRRAHAAALGAVRHGADGADGRERGGARAREGVAEAGEERAEEGGAVGLHAELLWVEVLGGLLHKQTDDNVRTHNLHLVCGGLRDVGQQPAGLDSHVRARVPQVVLDEQDGVVELRLQCVGGGGQKQHAKQLEQDEADGFGGFRGVEAGMLLVVAFVLRS